MTQYVVVWFGNCVFSMFLFYLFLLSTDPRRNVLEDITECWSLVQLATLAPPPAKIQSTVAWLNLSLCFFCVLSSVFCILIYTCSMYFIVCWVFIITVNIALYFYFWVFYLLFVICHLLYSVFCVLSLHDLFPHPVALFVADRHSLDDLRIVR